MLLLTRKLGEEIVIGEDIVLTVMRIGPDTVRIGLSAPRDVPIWRRELLAPTAAHAASEAPEPSET